MLKENNLLNEIINNAFQKLHESNLKNLFDYLSKPSDKDVFNNGEINTKLQAYNYFENPMIVKNIWCLHFTWLEAYEEIRKNGFNNGVLNFDELAYSQNYGNRIDEPHNDGGWIFGLPINNEYIGEDCGYGDCGFIVKTDGVKAYHKGDGDEEIIFQNDNVKEIIPFMFDEDMHLWIITSNNIQYDINHLPKGCQYNKDFRCFGFTSLRDMVSFAIS